MLPTHHAYVFDGLDVLMDMGWIATYGSDTQMTVQLSVMSEPTRPALALAIDACSELGSLLSAIHVARIVIR